MSELICKLAKHIRCSLMHVDYVMKGCCMTPLSAYLESHCFTWTRKNKVDELSGFPDAGESGNALESQLIPISHSTQHVQQLLHDNGALPDLQRGAEQELVFMADLPALGYASFLLKQSKDASSGSAVASEEVDWESRPGWNRSSEGGLPELIEISNGAITAKFSSVTGQISTITTR